MVSKKSTGPVGFHFKCPFCGQIEWYETTEKDLKDAEENLKKIFTGKCPCCHHVWIRYAFVLFGTGTGGPVQREGEEEE